MGYSGAESILHNSIAFASIPQRFYSVIIIHLKLFKLVSFAKYSFSGTTASFFSEGEGAKLCLRSITKHLYIR